MNAKVEMNYSAYVYLFYLDPQLTGFNFVLRELEVLSSNSIWAISQYLGKTLCCLST